MDDGAPLFMILQLFALDNEWLRGDLITAPGTIEHLAAWHRARWGRPQSRSLRPPPSPSWTPPSPPHPPSPWRGTHRTSDSKSSTSWHCISGLLAVGRPPQQLQGPHQSPTRLMPPAMLHLQTREHPFPLKHLSLSLCLSLSLSLALCRCLSYTYRQPFFN